ncbi:MAG: leucine-rich repeat domain-containing protein [Muribaculaceae bacterium]|nr:leucine-rich repeat domain-containing protein [Muribaculaceae bacterium]
MLMKSLKSLLTLLLCMVPLTIFAKIEYVYVDDICYSVNPETGSASIRQQDYFDRPYIKVAIIPESVAFKGVDYPVVTLEERAFYGCTELTKVVIPNSVTSIDEDAFRYCSSLVDVTLPMSLTSLSKGMFDGCESLESIELPTAITSIPEFCFHNCKALKSIVIPEGVETIESQAFDYTYRLSSVTIPGSLKETRSVLSAAEYPLIPTIHISDLDAFFRLYTEHSNLCGNSTWYLSLNGDEVTDVVVPEGIDDIDIWKRCESLESITTPNSVEICNFDGCDNLRFISMSASTKIVRISLVENLERVDIYSKEPPELSTVEWIVRNAILHVPVGCKEAYANNEEWSMFSSIIDDLTGDSKVDEVQNEVNYSLPCEIFNLQGVFLGKSLENLPKGVYVIRQGENSKKLLIK